MAQSGFYPARDPSLRLKNGYAQDDAQIDSFQTEQLPGRGVELRSMDG